MSRKTEHPEARPHPYPLPHQRRHTVTSGKGKLEEALPGQIERSITSRRLIGQGESLLVAVSGGLDSMVLVHLLNALAARHGWTLTVAHFNHRLRGRSSQADESLVRKTARRLKLKCVVASTDIRQLARQNKKSIEMAAREARHRFLAATAKRIGAAKVVLAHHADDQIELFFLRLFRGSGSDGLSGMKWSNPSPANPEVRLVRPLLETPKSALVEFAREHEIPFREDATNAQVDIPRNRIRHELLPLLRAKLQPQLDRVVPRTMDILGAESDFVLQSARDWLSHREGLRFRDLPVALQRRVLLIQMLDQGVVPEFDQLEILRLNPGSVVEFGREKSADDPWKRGTSIRLMVDKEGRIQIAQPAAKFPEALKEVQVCVGLGVRTSLSGRTKVKKAGRLEFDRVQISWEVVQGTPKLIPKPLVGREMFDADQVGSRFLLRHWRPGDRFQPIGMENEVKLQDYFVNAKVPRAERHRRLVAVSETGAIFWVEGMRISERFKLTPSTTRSLQWVWKRH